MENKSQFLIPYAVDEKGGLVGRHEAISGQGYFCLVCEKRLIVRAGSMKAKHFAHLGELVCSYETVVHAVAKRLVVEVIRLWKAGGARPQVRRRCESCKGEGFQYLPDKVVNSVVECRLESGYIVDVALFSESGVVAAVEVYVTHLVTKDKSKGLEVPWVELKGEEIILDPLLWKPITDRFRSYKCTECKVQTVEKEKVLKRISEQLGIRLPWGNYCAAPYECYRCEREILVFTWPDHSMWAVEKPPFPIPPSVKFSYTKTTKSWYWANTCLYCNAVQGDFFIFLEM